RPWRIVFQEKEIDVEGVEQLVRDQIVAALGMPMPPAIAAAEMHADTDAVGAAQNAVGDVDVAVDQQAPVIAARGERRLDGRIAELGERGFIDLHISAT